jgi:LacI family transcriptional regulator
MAETAPSLVKTTLRDVAQEAGVSLSTASRVLNGASGVSGDLARRVREAAAALNYFPNIAARSLRVSRTMTFGVVFSRLQTSVALDALHAIDAASREAGYTLFFASANDDPESARVLLRRFFERRVDGLFVYRPREIGDALQLYHAAGIPTLALMSRSEDCADIPMATYDIHTANREALKRMRALGHRAVVYLLTQSDLNDGRALDLEEAAREIGLAAYLRPMPDPHDPASVVRVAEEARALPVPATAILIRTRHIPVLLSGLRAAGRRAPEDYSLMSYGQSEWLDGFAPRIARIQADTKDLGRTALHTILEALDGEPIPNIVYSAPGTFVDAPSIGPAPAVG